jgi:mycothiol synthase
MPPAVSLAASHELLPALRLLFPEVVELPRAGIEAGVVLVARDPRGQVAAATLVQALPGALGLVQSSGSESPEAVAALALAACDWLRGRGVKVCQVFGTGDEEDSRATALERCGFQRITQLVSLRRALGAEGSRAALAFAAEQPPFTEAFRAVLLATDRDTLDCPELNGARSDDELFASFAEPRAGAAWHLARHAGEAIGVVMLAPGALAGELELAYLGVVPTARRRGFGGELLAFARTEAARAGASSLSVSVDSRNNPALQLYHRDGFAKTGRRVVWLAHFSCAAALPAQSPAV